ncbi:hypothetical protein SK128_011867 [Halocaridina rubra]|uniref:RING-type E3 ubiquitin transferase n=1 Tax=Halocaridina rubra TaxID=373956 RepID=A0AAN8XKT1_HALRR
MSVATSLPWPSNIPELKRLDELLRCGICYELMSTSMITGCSHNYCSLCIRQYLGYKTQCPACFREATSQQLRNNRLLDEIILLFPSLRDKAARQFMAAKGTSISGYLTGRDGGIVEENDGVSSDGESREGTSTITKTPNTKGVAKDVAIASPLSQQLPGKNKILSFMSPSMGETPSKTTGEGAIQRISNTPHRKRIMNQGPLTPGYSGSGSPSLPQKSPSASISRSRNTLGSASPSTSAALTQSGCQSVSGYYSILSDRGGASGNAVAQDSPKVSCPVCNVSIPERNINVHLDACLKRMEEIEKVEVVSVEEPPKRKPLPKLVYSLLSEKQLRLKLKEIGLSVQGEKQVLVNRHRRYTILYNAECDVIDPRPISEILRQIEREEKEESKGTVKKSIFNYDRKTAPEIIEKEQVRYMKQNSSLFSSLIADVRRRQAEAKLKKKNMEDNKEDQLTEKSITSPNISAKEDPNKKNSGKKDKNHYISSSEYESSDSDSAKEKLTNSNGQNQNSILNFFKNSPQKTFQSPVKSCVSGDNLPRTSYRDETFNYADDVPEQSEAALLPVNKDKLLLEESNETLASSSYSKVGGTSHALEEAEREPLPTFSLEAQNHIGKNGTISSNIGSQEVNQSPDMFGGSDVGSDCSNASESLLKDQDFMDSPQSALLLTGHEDSDSNDIPTNQPESYPLGKETISKPCDWEDEEEDEIIPGHQPESCPIDEIDSEMSPSPSIGRRVTRNRTPAVSQTKPPDLSSLGPETQVVEPSTQLDPDYQPSQLYEDMLQEDLDFDTARKPRRSARKRPSTEEPPKPSRKMRKKKSQFM